MLLPYFIKRFISFFQTIIGIFLVLGLFLSPLKAQTKTESMPLKMISLRIVGDAKRVRIIAAFNANPNYDVMLLGQPPRLVINLPKTDFLVPFEKVVLNGLIKDVRYGLAGADRARIILSSKTSFKIEKINSEQLQDQIWQLSIDMVEATDKEFNETMRAVQENRLQKLQRSRDMNNTNKNQPFTVVIDAGHGGFDSGAEGVKGVLEKNITLAFAKTLQEEFNRRSNINARLTRNDDTYLRLGERVRIAHSYKADIFISIHADSIHLPDLRGATVYTISDKASDSLSKAIADKENKSDLLGGVPTEEPPEVADILIDLTRRETDTFSVKLAEDLVASFKRGKINLITNPHRYAGFMVLRASDIPSVLIEMGYLSNIQDEKLINDPAWRKKMAELIANAVEEYAESRIPLKNK